MTSSHFTSISSGMQSLRVYGAILRQVNAEDVVFVRCIAADWHSIATNLSGKNMQSDQIFLGFHENVGPFPVLDCKRRNKVMSSMCEAHICCWLTSLSHVTEDHQCILYNLFCNVLTNQCKHTQSDIHLYCT